MSLFGARTSALLSVSFAMKSRTVHSKGVSRRKSGDTTKRHSFALQVKTKTLFRAVSLPLWRTFEIVFEKVYEMGMLKMTEKLSRKMTKVPYVGIYHRKLTKLDFTPSQMLENVPIK